MPFTRLDLLKDNISAPRTPTPHDAPETEPAVSREMRARPQHDSSHATPLTPGPSADDLAGQLIDEYVSISEEIAWLKERRKNREAALQETEEAIVAYAQARGIDEVTGTAKRLMLTAEAAAQLPAKDRNPEDHAHLEKALRDSPHWNQISCFDRYALLRIWNGRQRDPGDVRALIEPFVKVRTKVKFVLLPRHDGGIRAPA